MSVKSVVLAAAILGATGLGGCSSFPGVPWPTALNEPASAKEPTEASAQSRTSHQSEVERAPLADASSSTGGTTEPSDQPATPRQGSRDQSASQSASAARRVARAPASSTSDAPLHSDIAAAAKAAQPPNAFTPEWWAREKAIDDRLKKKMEICRC